MGIINYFARTMKNFTIIFWSIEMGVFGFFFISFVHCSWTTHFGRFFWIVKKIEFVCSRIYSSFFIYFVRFLQWKRLFSKILRSVKKYRFFFKSLFEKNRSFCKRYRFINSLFQKTVRSVNKFFSFVFKKLYRFLFFQRSIVIFWTTLLFSKNLFVEKNDAHFYWRIIGVIFCL